MRGQSQPAAPESQAGSGRPNLLGQSNVLSQGTSNLGAGPVAPDQAGLGIPRGCAFALASTLLTCGLLFINGALVSALCTAASDSWPALLSDHRVLQFLLFVGPVVLVIIEWMMIDYVVSRMRRQP